MTEWFEAKVSYTKQTDNGLIKKVTEQYLVDAMSFTETEARVMQEAGDGMREVIAVAMKRSPIKDVVFYGDTDLWHKVKVTYSLMDEDTENEKKVTTYLLVNSSDVKEAYARTEEHLKEMLVPFQIPKIEESPICEVFQYEKQAPEGFKKVEKHSDEQECAMESETVESEFHMPDHEKYTVEMMEAVSAALEGEVSTQQVQRIVDQARALEYSEFSTWMRTVHDPYESEIRSIYGIVKGGGS